MTTTSKEELIERYIKSITRWQEYKEHAIENGDSGLLTASRHMIQFLRGGAESRGIGWDVELRLARLRFGPANFSECVTLEETTRLAEQIILADSLAAELNLTEKIDRIFGIEQ